MCRCLNVSPVRGPARLTIAVEPLESWVLGNLEREPVLWSQLFQLGENAISDGRYAWRVSAGKHSRLTLCHQAVHHPLHQLDLVLDGKVDEIGIDEDAVRRPEIRVVREKESALVRSGRSTYEDDTCVLRVSMGSAFSARHLQHTHACAPLPAFPSLPSLPPFLRFLF